MPTQRTPQPECFVKLAVPEDAITLSFLLQQCFPDTLDTPSSILSRLTSENFLGIEACNNQSLLGFLEMKVQGTGLYLFNLAIAPTARNQGIASLLLNLAESIATWAGIPYLFLHVEPVQYLLNFYQKRGFQILGTEDVSDRLVFAMTKTIL